MKKTILSVTALLTFSAYSQTIKPFVIEHCKDKMTDIEYYFASKKMICANPEKTKGFTITPSFKGNEGVIQNTGFMLVNINIGNCDEKDQLIFLFDDESKITINSWNKFNCKGNAYFNLTEDELNSLKTKLVTTIRFVNGYTSDSFTYTLKKLEKDYFINVYSNYIIKEVNCDN